MDKARKHLKNKRPTIPLKKYILVNVWGWVENDLGRIGSGSGDVSGKASREVWTLEGLGTISVGLGDVSGGAGAYTNCKH